MYYKCCVDNCQSHRKNVKLHQFPASEILLHKWLQCINSERLRNLSIQEIRRVFICHKHFERKVITKNSRIHLGAYPTLFSEDEIRSGLPSVAHKDENKENMKFDHCYNRRKHEDHTYYCKLGLSNIISPQAAAKNRLRFGSYPSLFTESEIASGIPEKVAEKIVNLRTDHSYFKNRHEDHTYCKFTEYMEFIRNNDHPYCKKRHNDHTYVKLKVESLIFSRNVTFCVPVHRFPHPIKKPDLFDAWVSVVGDKLDETDQIKIFKSKGLCDHHFDPIDKMSIDRIKPSAIPSVNLHRIQQGCTTFLQADHCYTRAPRGSVGSVPMMDIKNLPGPSRVAVDPIRSPLPSGSMGTTCLTGSDKSQFLTLHTKLDADQETNINPEFNPPLSNNENEPGTGESRRNEKTEVDNRNPYAEGIPDLNDEEDQESTFQNLRGSKSAQDPVFSWEKKVEVVPADDGDAVVCLENKGTQEDLPPEISLYCDDDFSPDNEDSDKVPEYQCNECREVITGFRYTCVQCADWDLCAACEARGAHDAHYVLRVPGQRPYSEIQAVLAAIRQQILSENLFLNPVDDSLKMEVKSEHGEDPPGAESGPPPDLDSLPDLELLPDLDPLPVPDPIGEQRPDSENSFTDSSEESVSDAGSPSRTETPDQPFTHTEYLESSSDDSDASHSPLRKRNRTTPIETHENVAPKPAIVQDNPGLAGYTIKPRDTIALTCRQLKKVHPSQIPRQILANVSATSKPRANLAHSVSRANPTRFNQGVMRTRPNPAPLLIPQHQVIIEEPVESIAHQQASTFVPSILKRGRPRTLELEDPAIHRTDHEREIIVESEPTLRPEDFSAPIQDLRLEGNSERIQDSYLEENAEQLNEPSEFCLRLPPSTDEESLIQALQCPVTVRLKRDF